MKPRNPQELDEKRRRLSFLKGKYKDQYKPSEAHIPKPKDPLIKISKKDVFKVTKKGLRAVEKQARKMPSDQEMTSFIWGNKNEQ